MKAEYIFSLVVISLFVFVLLLFLISYLRGNMIMRRKQSDIEKMYSDKNIVRMDYDLMEYDEETLKLLTEKNGYASQITIDDLIKRSPEGANKTEPEGLEEITGSYKPR